METSVPPEVISSHLRTLSCSGLHVNLVYKLVICLECSEALDYRYLRGHVTQHGLTCPPEDELIAILQDLHLAGPPPLSAFHVIPPIVGLKLTDGFTCLAESCGINVGSRASLMRHREECHVGLAVSSEPCQVHRIYGFRGCQLVVRVDPSLAVVRSHGTLAEYLAVMRPKEQRSLLPLQPSDDPRKTTGFLHQSKWLQTVSGRSTQDVLSLVARPKNGDIFFPVVQAVKTNFKRMWDDVESMEVLPRRHIHTPKGFVAHHLDLFFFTYFLPSVISTPQNSRIDRLDALKPRNTYLDAQIIGPCIYAPFSVLWTRVHWFSRFPSNSWNTVGSSVLPWLRTPTFRNPSNPCPSH